MTSFAVAWVYVTAIKKMNIGNSIKFDLSVFVITGILDVFIVLAMSIALLTD